MYIEIILFIAILIISFIIGKQNDFELYEYIIAFLAIFIFVGIVYTSIKYHDFLDIPINNIEQKTAHEGICVEYETQYNTDLGLCDLKSSTIIPFICNREKIVCVKWEK